MPKDKTSFLNWYSKTSKKLGLDPDPYSQFHQYDYEGFFTKYGNKDMIKGEHFTDEFKLPDHPTFSKESKYSNKQTIGGEWVKMDNGTWAFEHSPYTSKHYKETGKYLEGSGEIQTLEEIQVKPNMNKKKNKGNKLSSFPINYIPSSTQYGFGSWLKKNAGMIGTVVGGLGAIALTGGAAAPAVLGAAGLGSSVGGQIGGSVSAGAARKEAAQEQQLSKEELERQAINNQILEQQGNQSYTPVMAYGGKLYKCGGKMMAGGGFIPSYDSNMFIPKEYAEGGKIYIKPENRGKFTETKQRTGKTTEELTHSKNPLTRKRAIFAKNASKWKHANGGAIDDIYSPTQEFKGGGYLGNPESPLTYFNTGKKHETNSMGGIPVSKGALVEEGEYMFTSPKRGKYIFSNRL